MNIKHEEERKNAVERTKVEERKTMHLELEAQKKIYEKEKDSLNEVWHAKFKQSQAELRAKLDKDAEKRFSLTREQIKFEKNKEIDELRETYEKELNTLRSDYSDKNNDLLKMRSRIDGLNFENEQLKAIVQELRQELKECIEHFSIKSRSGNVPKSILKSSSSKGLKITFKT
jgi:hypothetical protein